MFEIECKGTKNISHMQIKFTPPYNSYNMQIINMLWCGVFCGGCVR